MTTVAELKDYAVELEDGSGRKLSLTINADDVRTLVSFGVPALDAIADMEEYALYRAVLMGQIDADAWYSPRGSICI